MPDDERGQADVGDDHPPEGLHGQRAPGKVGIGSGVGAPGIGTAGGAGGGGGRRRGGAAGTAGTAGPASKAGVAYGVSPTSSAGGPWAASRRIASTSSPCNGGSVAVTASTAPAQRDPLAARARRSSSRPARWSSSS